MIRLILQGKISCIRGSSGSEIPFLSLIKEIIVRGMSERDLQMGRNEIEILRDRDFKGEEKLTQALISTWFYND